MTCFITGELKEMLPNWVFDEVEVEESITSTSDYHSDTSTGATGGDVVTSQPRIKGRSQQNSVGKRYEVSVDLRALLSLFGLIFTRKT